MATTLDVFIESTTPERILRLHMQGTLPFKPSRGEFLILSPAQLMINGVQHLPPQADDPDQQWQHNASSCVQLTPDRSLELVKTLSRLGFREVSTMKIPLNQETA